MGVDFVALTYPESCSVSTHDVHRIRERTLVVSRLRALISRDVMSCNRS